MAKGRPRVTPEVMERLRELALEDFARPGKRIESILVKEFKDKDVSIPAIRTCQHYAKVFREQWMQRVDDQPWSLALMDKAGIPWEATHFLLGASIGIQKEGGRLFPETDSLMEELHERELLAQWKPPEAGVMTVRQAKWLWRLYLALPDVKLRNIFWRADMYSHREMMTDYLGYPFDTSDLDRGLMTLLYHLKPWKYPPRKKEKEAEENQITGKEE